MRIDKFLWSVRLYKTRTLASNAVKLGKVKVNSNEVKSSHEIKIGDKLDLRKGNYRYSYKTLGLPKTRVGAKLIPEYLLETTSIEHLEHNKIMAEARKQSAFVDYSEASKSNKRQLRDWKNKLKGLND